MKAVKPLLVLFLVIYLNSSAFAVYEKVFPYIGISLTTPGIEDPFPGFGTYYSSLALGIDSIYWNPASLGYINSAQASIGFSAAHDALPYLRNYEVEDITFEVASSGGSEIGFTNAILFTGDQTTTTVTTREFRESAQYSTYTSSINYKQAIKVSDWFAFGITARGGAGADINIVGDFPATYLMDFNLYGSQNFLGTGISINPTGQLTFSYNEGGVSYIHTSEASAWNGFLRQTNRVPFTILAEARNDIKVNSDLTFTGATKWNELSIGLNMTPIAASANVDNSARVIVNSDTTDPYFYVPDFDPNDESDALNWLGDPDKFGSETGYKKRYIEVPEGESIGEARYRGFFNASTMKMDLGIMYNVNDWLSVGAALENFGGASLDFTGTGLVSYVNHRVSTSPAGSIIDPAAETGWSPFQDSFISMEGTEDLGMLPSFSVLVPQKTRLGLTLRKPWLISIDYETQNTPIYFRYMDENEDYVDAQISDIRILRIGMETQVFALPWWLRSGTGLLFKPTITGMDPDVQENIDNAFKFGVLPVKLDLGTDANFWGYIVGIAGGFNLTPVISAYQLDISNMDANKFLFYSLYTKKDNWKVTYAANLDTGSTASAYGNRTKDIDNVGDAMEIIKMIQTITFSFKF